MATPGSTACDRASPTRLMRLRTRSTPRGPQPRARARQATRAWRIKMKSWKGDRKRSKRWFMPRSGGKPAAGLVPGLGHLAGELQIFGSQNLCRVAPADGLPGDQQGLGKIGPHLLEVVQHRDDRPVFVVPAVDHAEEIGRGPGIDGGEGFIEQNDRTVLQQQAGEQHPLELSRRQIADGSVLETFQAHRGQSLPGLLP